MPAKDPVPALLALAVLASVALLLANLRHAGAALLLVDGLAVGVLASLSEDDAAAAVCALAMCLPGAVGTFLYPNPFVAALFACTAAYLFQRLPLCARAASAGRLHRGDAER